LLHAYARRYIVACAKPYGLLLAIGPKYPCGDDGGRNHKVVLRLHRAVDLRQAGGNYFIHILLPGIYGQPAAVQHGLVLQGVLDAVLEGETKQLAGLGLCQGE